MISIIAAIAENGVIGADNKLLWHIREDLQRFKRITTGHPVVMGRKTFESLGRPLPDRTNVIVTRQKDFRADGCTVVHSLDQAIGLFPARQEIFIIGGAEIYRAALPSADRLYLTAVEAAYPGDTRFPEWNRQEWRPVFEQRHERGETFEHPFTFLDYERKK
jgi:dihydrofolate reductase